MRTFLIIILYFAAAWTAGCSIHRLDVQQGNVIKPEMVQKLTPGMTKRQVEFVMGTPLIQDPFRADRWDYVYAIDTLDKHQEIKRVSVFFQDDRVVRIVPPPAAATP